MKTAMQELIERLEQKQSMWDKKSKEHIDIANTYYVAIIMAKKMLEKEKEQSINLIKQTCMFMGASIIDIEISKMEFEDVYNSYFNQNK